jgi:hypothetical protein
MESRLRINNEITNLIIKLCFSINELKKSLQPNNKDVLQFFTTYEDIKNKMDEILQAISARSMSGKIKDTKALVKNYLSIYNLLPADFGSRDQTITILDVIFNELSALDKLISN